LKINKIVTFFCFSINKFDKYWDNSLIQKQKIEYTNKISNQGLSILTAA
jgi:hypothetical protein